MERDDNESEKKVESSTTKNMFSVVEQINSGYGKYFDSKSTTSTTTTLSDCYSNYKACGSKSQEQSKQCIGSNDEGSNLEKSALPVTTTNQNIIQEVLLDSITKILLMNRCRKKFIFQFFPKNDEPKQRSNDSGCCKYPTAKNGK